MIFSQIELIEVIYCLLAIVGGVVTFRRYHKDKKLIELEKFVTFRRNLKNESSLRKIVSHIQLWNFDSSTRNIIPDDITLFDFYYFIGFYEEINILISEGLLQKKMAKEMFAFYAIEMAENPIYWQQFNEDYTTDANWKNFKQFVNRMKAI
ncbi:MAG: hypothetical protein RL106_1185 [Bacteroidota bacterium]|jgi:hypothetical protein